MVTKSQEYKTSHEILDIAEEMLLLLVEKHNLTHGETSMVIFQMGEGERFVKNAEHIERMMRHDD